MSAPPVSEPPALAAEAAPAPPLAVSLSRPVLYVQPPPPASVPKPQAASLAAPVYHSAEPVYQARPVFPTSLRNVVTKPMMVQVLVSIDETGKVVKADPQAQPGVHPMLLVSAASAARQWKFRPARRGDQPVPGQMLLRFNFAPVQ